MSENLCVDLCCGWGGFSEAFVKAGWEVIRIDIERKFKPTIIADVNHLPLKLGLKPKICVASPPCERFSIANRRFPKKGIKKALEIVGACLEAFVELETKYWVLENPKGRLRWFLGSPTQSIHLSNYGGKYMKPTDLWGNVELPMLTKVLPYEPSWSSTKNNGNGSTGLLRLRDPSKRALMPYGLSQAILEVIT